MGVEFWRFVGAYIRTNWNAAIEYRVSLVSQILGMFINDALWVIFWVLYFTKFPVLNGWELQDVLVLWATVTTSFGLVGGVALELAAHPLAGGAGSA